MVWMITIIGTLSNLEVNMLLISYLFLGYTMGIPDTVMGLTFVAAGVSVPDALSSIAVIKEGFVFVYDNIHENLIFTTKAKNDCH